MTDAELWEEVRRAKEILDRREKERRERYAAFRAQMISEMQEILQEAAEAEITPEELMTELERRWSE